MAYSLKLYSAVFVLQIFRGLPAGAMIQFILKIKGIPDVCKGFSVYDLPFLLIF